MREHASGPGHRWRAPIRPRAGRSLCGSALPCGKGSRQVGQPQRILTTIPPLPPGRSPAQSTSAPFCP